MVNASIVADTVLGGMFVAGRSCGPPDALSSSTLAAIRQKYINSTCYYAGHILRAITNNNTDTTSPPCYNATFESDIVLVPPPPPLHPPIHSPNSTSTPDSTLCLRYVVDIQPHKLFGPALPWPDPLTVLSNFS